eukprot:GHVN01093709.1.p1 GENE.GHVN01093709.1~~GHVN01093709.1.p1  ORF type:complete len:2403 (+),score=325.49 GHVN01093709.1:991-7209(+)
MNRGMLLQRTPPDRKDLIKIGNGIVDPSGKRLTDALIPDLVDGYLQVFEKQDREYFGLRDFYSLVKMISSEARRRGEMNLDLIWPIIEKCVRRNFGGYFGDFQPATCFLSKIKIPQRNSPSNMRLSERELIEEALQAKSNRYLLILTRNNAALKILKLGSVFECGKLEILFGSSFEGDLEYTQICHNINRIKICMETGQQLVLVNLETLYESLYDALNQSYSYMGGNRYVDLGLGSHRVKCRVHKDFRLILVAEVEDVMQRFPIPLINRVEKHYLGMETILDRKRCESVEVLRAWVKTFCEIDIPAYRRAQFRQYTAKDVFMGFHEEVIASLLIQCNESDSDEEVERKCKARLLQSATPASIMRLSATKLGKAEAEEYFDEYFQKQSHDTLANYIQTLPHDQSNFVEVNTHSRLLSQYDKEKVASCFNIDSRLVSVLALKQFKSEEELRKEVSVFLQNDNKEVTSNRRTVVIQIDGSEKKLKTLIESTRYIIHGIINEVGEADQGTSGTGNGRAAKRFNVVMIVRLQFSSGQYVGYPAEPWKSVHIDTISTHQGHQPMKVCSMRGRSIYDIFNTEVEQQGQGFPLLALIESVLPKAASMVKGGNPCRTVERIEKCLTPFRKNLEFRQITLHKIVQLLKVTEDPGMVDWLSQVSLYSPKLKEGSTFQTAIWHRLQERIAPLVANISTPIDILKGCAMVHDLVEDYVHDLVYTSINVPEGDRLGGLIVKWVLSEILRKGSEEGDSADEVRFNPKSIDRLFTQLKDNIVWFIHLTQSNPDIVEGIQRSVQGGTKETPLVTALNLAIKTLTPDFANFEEAEVRKRWMEKAYQLMSVIQQMKQAGDKRQGVRWGEWTRCEIFLHFIHNVFIGGLTDELKQKVCSKLGQMWMCLEDPELNKQASFDKLFLMLRIINVHTAKLHYPGGVNECAKCKEAPRGPVALPCGHVACKVCLNEFFGRREKKRCPSDNCKTPDVPDDFEIESSADVSVVVRHHDGLRQSLNVFFLDVLKTYCFAAGEEPPAKEVFEKLLNLAFFKSSKGEGEDLGSMRTKQLSPFDEYGVDDNPTVRSCLLQLCLQSDQKLANKYISAFMGMHEGNGDEVVELMHLYMNCVEDTVEDTAVMTVVSAPLRWNEDGELTNLSMLRELCPYKVGLEGLAQAIVGYFESRHNDGGEALARIKRATRDWVGESPSEFKTFLVKEICFKYRSDVISEMKKEMVYLLPKELVHSDDDSVGDIYNIAGSLYLEVKGLLGAQPASNDREVRVEEFVKGNGQQGSLVLLLALYNEALNSTSEAEEVFVERFQIIEKFSKIPLATIFKVRNLIQTGLSQRRVELIKISCLAKSGLSLTQPSGGVAEFFSALINSPNSLANMFLPSMPHDIKYEVMQKAKAAGGGGVKTWYYCPCGHVYGIGDCGQPNEKGKCPDCRKPIGGGASPKNLEDVIDKTERGYLIKGGDQDKLKEGIRNMGLFETEFFRLLFHLACLAGLHDKVGEVSDLCGFDKKGIEGHLLEQVDDNIAKCALLSNFSQDDIMILLADLMKKIPTYDGMKFDLVNQNGRVELEKQFVDYLRLNYKTLDEVKKVYKANSEKTALQALLSTKAEGTTKLNRLLRVRSRVTGDNLLQWMITNDKVSACPTLEKMLSEIALLEELGALPQILQLQSFLLERFSGKLSSTEMEHIKIKEFSEEKIDQVVRERFVSQAEVLLQTWNKLKDKIAQYEGSLGYEVSKTEIYSMKETNTTQNTPAAFLLPASKGAGLCSYGLVMCMIDAQNKLSKSSVTINPYQASVYQLAAFKKADLQSLLLSHTSYTFPHSGFTKEEYDVVGMERKVVERFVHSNPRLNGDAIKKVQYLEHRSGREEHLLTNKIPQVELDINMQTQLEKELIEFSDLCQLLESVCTVRDFLLEVGGKENTNLPEFMEELSLYIGEGNAGSSPLRHFMLCQVDSLIKFMGLVRAKVMIRNEQNPFEPDIPKEYRVPLDNHDFLPDLLKSLSPQWLLSNLFTLIWTKLRATPTGDSTRPDWTLKEGVDAIVGQEGEDVKWEIDSAILCKHAVDLFISVTRRLFEHQSKEQTLCLSHK